MTIMKFSEKIDHLLRQYNYKRRRGSSANQSANHIELEEYLGQVDSYVSELMEEVDKFFIKIKK